MDFTGQITFCSTTDLAHTARFYEDVIGLKLALDQGTCRIYRVRGGAWLGFCARDEAEVPDGLIITLLSDDVDGWYERLREHGVPVDGEPRLHPQYRIYHFFAQDPEGYRLEIQCFEDPRWNG